MESERNVPPDSGTMWSGLSKGIWSAGPIVLGYVPVGFAFGVLAQKAGLSAFNTLLMSLIVYAGAAQFIAVGLIAGAASPLSVIVTTFVVNLRHLIMASALAPHLGRFKFLELALFSSQLTDETFALHSLRFAEKAPVRSEVFGRNLTAHAAWVVSTGLGLIAGTLIGDVTPWALDFALPAMFVALLTLSIRNRVQVVVALAAGFIAVIMVMVGAKTWAVILAAVFGATLGAVLESRRNPK